MTRAKRARSQTQTGRPTKRRQRVPPPRERDQEQTVKRPDVARRKQEAKLFRQYVVKASFTGLLNPDLGQDGKIVFNEVLEEHIEAISKMSVQASLVANETLLKYLRRGQLPTLDVTFFRRCMTANGESDEILQAVLDRHFGNHPPIDRTIGDWQLVTWAAKQLYTNFQNNIWMNFESRLFGFVKEWVRICNVGEYLVPVIFRLILGRSIYDTYVLPQGVWRFIGAMRASLGFDPEEGYPMAEFIPERAPLEVMIRFSFEILDFYLFHGLPGGFSLVPVHKVKRHYVTLCTTGLYLVLSNIFRRMGESTPEWIQEVTLQQQSLAIEEYRDLMWRRTFRLDRLSRGEFHWMIETDGVAASVHFRKRKKTDTGTSSLSPTEIAAQRVIAIDPGRKNLITACEKLDDDRYRFWSLSRGGYYGSFQSSTKKLARWESALADINAQLSNFSIRSADPELCAGYRRVYFEQYNRWWDAKLQKKWAREKFYVYSAKRSCIDRFFGSFCVAGQERPVVLYGAVKLRSHGPGELSVPVKRVFEACKRFYATIKVNEYLTTQCHSVCHARMHPVKNEGANRPAHGLKYCARCKMFVNRDRDACKSILHAGTSNPRPAYLSFKRPYEYKETLTCLPAPKSRGM